jgi:hypothetical protein
MVVSFGGWFIIGISALIFLVSLGKMHEFGGGMSLMISLAGIIAGLPLVLFGQVTQAVVDTADHLGEILAIMKAKQ